MNDQIPMSSNSPAFISDFIMMKEVENCLNVGRDTCFLNKDHWSELIMNEVIYFKFHFDEKHSLDTLPFPRKLSPKDIINNLSTEAGYTVKQRDVLGWRKLTR